MAPAPGRVPDGWFDEKRATVRMAEMVAEHAERGCAATAEDRRRASDR